MTSMKELTEKLASLLDTAKTAEELEIIVETMLECYNENVIILTLLNEIIKLKQYSCENAECDA